MFFTSFSNHISRPGSRACVGLGKCLAIQGLVFGTIGVLSACGPAAKPSGSHSPPKPASARPESPALENKAKTPAKPAESPPATKTNKQAALPYQAIAKVTGVQAPDTLNLRQTPDPKAQVIAKIPASATTLHYIGPHEQHKNSRWVRIGFDEKTGWVNQKFLAFSGSKRALSRPLECVGTEPFWHLIVDPSGLATFESMGGDTKPIWVTSMQEAVGQRSVWGLNFHGSDPKAPSSGFLSKSGTCSDGMSDHTYAYELFLSLGSQTALKGCCDLSKAPPTP